MSKDQAIFILKGLNDICVDYDPSQYGLPMLDNDGLPEQKDHVAAHEKCVKFLMGVDSVKDETNLVDIPNLEFWSRIDKNGRLVKTGNGWCKRKITVTVDKSSTVPLKEQAESQIFVFVGAENYGGLVQKGIVKA